MRAESWLWRGYGDAPSSIKSKEFGVWVVATGKQIGEDLRRQQAERDSVAAISQRASWVSGAPLIFGP